MLDLIGYSTVPEDIEVARGRLEKALDWLSAAPWWAILGFALISTLWLMWVSWPRQNREVRGKRPKPDAAVKRRELVALNAETASDPPSEVEQADESHIPKTSEALIPLGIWVNGTWHDDGMDIKFTIQIRNRSQRKLYLGKPDLDCKLDDLKPFGKKAGSKSEIKPSTSQHIWYPSIRIYDPDAKHSGWATFSISFGETRGKLDRTMHCGFLVEIDPIKIRPSGVAHYRAKASASCLTLEYDCPEEPTPISVLASELLIDTEEKKQP